MPLNEKGRKILHAMEKTYGSTKEAKSVLYASKNAGKITNIDSTEPIAGEDPADTESLPDVTLEMMHATAPAGTTVDCYTEGAAAIWRHPK